MFFKKSQAAIEFLTTYGWAISVMLIVISSFSYLGVVDLDSFAPERCVAPAGFVCEDFNIYLAENDFSFDLRFRVQLGDEVVFLNSSDFLVDKILIYTDSGVLLGGDAFSADVSFERGIVDDQGNSIYSARNIVRSSYGGYIEDFESDLQPGDFDKFYIDVFYKKVGSDDSFASKATFEVSGTVRGVEELPNTFYTPPPAQHFTNPKPDSNCYTLPPGTIGDSEGCDGMLIVDDVMLGEASFYGDGSYSIEGPDGNEYTFGDSEYNIFTGQLDTLSGLFALDEDFNEDIGYWDVSNVVRFSNMFLGASSFNQDIGGWDMSSAQRTDGMFQDASSFNQNLSNWDMSNVYYAETMFMSGGFFGGGTNMSFNGDISGWDVSSMETASNFFAGEGSNFNQDISNWDTSKMTSMSSMFRYNSEFNQDISNWDFSSAISFRNAGYSSALNYMLNDASSFNQNLSNICVQDLDEEPNGFLAGTAIENITSMHPKWGEQCEYQGCYHHASIGQIGQEAPCQDMLIVDRSMLSSAMSNNYTILGPDGNNYTFGDSEYNVFTGQVTDMSKIGYSFWDSFFPSDFNEDISYWDTSNVVYMYNMFREANNFNQDLSNWNVSNVKIMNSMFNGASSFNSDLSGWDVSNVKSMIGMFNGASSFNGDLSGWDVSNVLEGSFRRSGYEESRGFRGMFEGASSFEGKGLSSWRFNDAITDFSNMFKGASSFEENIDGWNTGQILTMESMFEGASSFNRGIGSWDVSNVRDMNSMFKNASSFNRDISSWSVEKAQNMDSMFEGALSFSQDISSWCFELIGYKPVGFDTNSGFENQDTLQPNWGSYCGEQLPYVEFEGCYNPASVGSIGEESPCQGMLIVDNESIKSVASTNAYDFDGSGTYAIAAHDGNFYSFGDSEYNIFTGQVTDMSELFKGQLFNDNSLNEDINYWDVSNVESMDSMFESASSFNSDLSGWDVSNVESMDRMFNYASSFDQDISGWDVSNVESMRGIFSRALSFNQPIGIWDVSNVIDMAYMFTAYSSDMAFNQYIGDWNMSSVEDTRSMFRGANNFNQDLSNWDTQEIREMRSMFEDASSFDQDISSWCVEVLSLPSSFATNSPIENKQGYNPNWRSSCNRWWLSDSDLIAHWSFDGITTSSSTIDDVSGNSKDLSVSGSISGVSHDIKGDAIVLDGNGDAELAQSNTANIQSGSIVGWIKPEFTGDTGHASNFLFHHNSGVDDRLYLALRTGEDNSWRIGLASSIIDPSNSQNPSGSWTHFALVWDGNNYEFYSDGALLDSGFFSGSMDTDNSVWSLATSISHSDRNFEGDIDEFMIFDRALSSSEVEDLYEAIN